MDGGKAYSSRLATDMPSEHDGTGSDVVRLDTNMVSVVKGDLHEEPGNILGPLFFPSLLVEQPQPSFGSGVTKSPTDGSEDVTLHLHKGILVVSLAAHFRQFLDKRYLVFGIFKFGGSPHSSATDQLVMFLVDDSFRYVSVD
jgi:hypothetical protein